MKLEVGMYVRFKDKRGIEYIRKITSVNNTYPNKLYAGIYIDKEANNSTGVSLQNIIKASFNIIDLLEAGDYVNGEEVYYDEEFNTLYVRGLDGDGDFYKMFITKKTFIDNIKSIVTKKQFEQMSYELEG